MKGFLRAGHTPTLVAALLYFDVSFMAWVLLGPLAPFLRSELGLTATQQGLVTAIPLLGGSLLAAGFGLGWNVGVFALVAVVGAVACALVPRPVEPQATTDVPIAPAAVETAS